MTPADRRQLSELRSSERPRVLRPITGVAIGLAMAWAAFHFSPHSTNGLWLLGLTILLLASVTILVLSSIIAFQRAADVRQARALRRHVDAALADGVVDVVAFQADAAWLISFPQLDTDQIVYRAAPDAFVVFDLPEPPPASPEHRVPAAFTLRRTRGTCAVQIGDWIPLGSLDLPLRRDLEPGESESSPDAPFRSVPGESLALLAFPQSWRATLAT